MVVVRVVVSVTEVLRRLCFRGCCSAGVVSVGSVGSDLLYYAGCFAREGNCHFGDVVLQL